MNPEVSDLNMNTLNITPPNKCCVTDCDCPDFVPNVWANTRCKNCMHHQQSHGRKPLNATVASLQFENMTRRQSQPNVLALTETDKLPRKSSSPARIPTLTRQPSAPAVLPGLIKSMRPSSLSPPSDRQRRSFSIRSSRDKEDLERALAGIQQPPPPVESAPPVEETKEGEEEPQRPASRRGSTRRHMRENSSQLRLTLFLSDIEDDTSPVHKYARTGEIELLRAIVPPSPEPNSPRSPLVDLNNNVNLQTPLHIAIENGQWAVAEYLVNFCFADLSVVDKIGRTPLLYAARYGSLELVELMIAKGARVDVMDGFNETMLHLAAVNEYPEIVKYLLEHTDININAQNTFKETSLHKAVRSGNLEIVKILVDMGADLQVKGAQGTPKELAASLVSLGSSRIDIYKFLDEEELKSKQKAEELETWEQEIPSETRRLSFVDSHTKMLMSLSSRVSPTLSSEDESLIEEVGSQLNSKLKQIYSVPEETQTEDEESLQSREDEEKPNEESPILAKPLSKDIKILPFCTEEKLITGLYEPYKSEFFKSLHANYVTKDLFPLDPEDGEKICALLSVKKTPFKGIHDALLITKWGFKKLSIDHAKVATADKSPNAIEESICNYLQSLSDSRNPILDNMPQGLKKEDKGQDIVKDLIAYHKDIRRQIKTLRKKGGWYPVKNKNFSLELLGLEAKLGAAKCFSVGVVLSMPDQNEEAMFANQTNSQFEHFLEILGDKIDIFGWSGYAGGFNPSCEKCETYYTSWRGFEVIFHVATLLNKEQQRRLIGNDKVIIYFQNKSTMTPQFRGNVNFQPVEKKGSVNYRLGCYTRSRLHPFPYIVPPTPIANRTQLKTAIMTTVINGIYATYHSPPFVYIMADLWRDSIAQLIDKYPKDK